MSTFEIIARRVITEARLDRYGVTSEAVLPWLVSRYQSVIGHMPMGEGTRQSVVASSTVAKYDVGTVSLTQGSTSVVGLGTLFVSGMSKRQIRIDSFNAWFNVAFVDSTHLALDTPWPEDSVSGAGYVIAQRYVTAPSGIRWLTQVNLPEVASLEERNSEWINDMFAQRSSQPSTPQYWIRSSWSQIDPMNPRRVIELYPAPDRAMRIEFAGYATIEEPTLESYPLVGIRDRLLENGALADAFNYTAGQEAAEKDGSVERVRARLDMASRHEKLFLELLRDASASDQRDMPQPHFRVVTGRANRGRKIDSIITAYDEVWRRP